MTETTCTTNRCSCCSELDRTKIKLAAYERLYRAVAVMLMITHGSSNRWAEKVAEVRETMAKHLAAPTEQCREESLTAVIEAVGLLVIHADAGQHRWMTALHEVRDAAAIVDGVTP